MDPEEVDEIPPEINDKKLYKIKTKKDKFCYDTRDDRYIVMRNSSENKFPGITKKGYCQGNYVCPNNKCPFMDFSTGKHPNKMHWKTFLGDGNKKVCEICDYYTVLDGCVARKQVQFDPVTNTALVYHLGLHTYQSKKFLHKRKQEGKEITNKLPEDYHQGDFPQKGMDRMSSMIGQGNIKEAQAEAYNWTNPRFASKILTKDKMEDTESEDLAGDDSNSFDAVAIVKKGTDR